MKPLILPVLVCTILIFSKCSQSATVEELDLLDDKIVEIEDLVWEADSVGKTLEVVLSGLKIGERSSREFWNTYNGLKSTVKNITMSLVETRTRIITEDIVNVRGHNMQLDKLKKNLLNTLQAERNLLSYLKKFYFNAQVNGDSQEQQRSSSYQQRTNEEFMRSTYRQSRVSSSRREHQQSQRLTAYDRRPALEQEEETVKPFPVANVSYVAPAPSPISSRKLIYSDDCRVNSYGTSDGISTPNYPSLYPAYTSCTWRIQVDRNYKVALNFKSFEVDSCVYDYVEVRDGLTGYGPVVGRYCGHNVPKYVRGRTNDMTVTFVSRTPVQRRGFYADVIQELNECSARTHGCQHYCHDTLDSYYCSCRAGYSLNTDKRTCSDVNECAVSNGGCSYYCVNSLGSFRCECPVGYQAEGSRCRRMTSAALTMCGGDIAGKHGTIRSVDYPREYSPNSDCAWTITVTPGYNAVLMFETMKIENSPDCQYDYVEIRDGRYATSPLLGRYCGNNPPADIRTTSNTAFVRFVSDSAVGHEGFSLKFIEDVDECKRTSHGCEHECTNTLGAYYCSCRAGYYLSTNGKNCLPNSNCGANNGGCDQVCVPTLSGNRCSCYGGYTLQADHKTCKSDSCSHKITGTKGVIQSPNYPYSYYYKPIECDWTFSTELGHRIELSFVDFHTYYDPICPIDYLIAYDGSRPSSPMITKHCGQTLPNPITSTGNNLYVQFFSQLWRNYKGFKAQYKAVCGGTLDATLDKQALVSHPNYGTEEYDNNQRCDWNIRVANGRRVFVRMEEFEVETSRDCTNDYLEVWDGDVSLGRYCGRQVPLVFTSSGTSLRFYFHTNRSGTAKGFKLFFSSFLWAEGIKA